jgi:G6PDH family F420-dependent oxidoreductase
METQGHSPFVWSTIGALSQVCQLPVTTAVTCPTIRIHPAIIAQAAATSAVLLNGRFTLGVGTGEALNEHIYGDPWPSADVRLDMLEEAVDVIRTLWRGGFVDYRGEYYSVDHARIYTLPEEAPPIHVSGFGPKSIEVAGRIGDGFICTKPDAGMVQLFRDSGGADKPASAGLKVCFAESEEEGVRIAHERWANEGLPGELAQVLPSPKHFEQGSQLVPPDMTRQSHACGRDPDKHLESLRRYVDAGYDDIYVNNIGPHWPGFFDLYAKEILSALR